MSLRHCGQMSKGGIRPEPIRPGARGGKDQFNWDNVKADKDREYYLGHSVKALAGRWQKGKDVYWYTREKDGGGSSLQDEIKAVKQREEEAMLEVSWGLTAHAAIRVILSCRHCHAHSCYALHAS